MVVKSDYGKHGKVVNHGGKVHEYLGVEIIFGMIKYVENMIKDFPKKLKSTDIPKTPAGGGLFNKGQGGKLPTEWAEAYHMMVAKGLFLCTHTKPNIQLTIPVLCTRVKDPNEANWGKLVRLMKYLDGTK
jgi:hypothetical protein